MIIITTRDSRLGNDIRHIGGKIQENEKKRVIKSKYEVRTSVRAMRHDTTSLSGKIILKRENMPRKEIHSCRKCCYCENC